MTARCWRKTSLTRRCKRYPVSPQIWYGPPTNAGAAYLSTCHLPQNQATVRWEHSFVLRLWKPDNNWGACTSKTATSLLVAAPVGRLSHLQRNASHLSAAGAHSYLPYYCGATIRDRAEGSPYAPSLKRREQTSPALFPSPTIEFDSAFSRSKLSE